MNAASIAAPPTEAETVGRIIAAAGPDQLRQALADLFDLTCHQLLERKHRRIIGRLTRDNPALAPMTAGWRDQCGRDYDDDRPDTCELHRGIGVGPTCTICELKLNRREWREGGTCHDCGQLTSWEQQQMRRYVRAFISGRPPGGASLSQPEETNASLALSRN